MDLRAYLEFVADTERHNRPDLAYPGIASLTLAFGRPYTRRPVPAGVPVGKMKECFYNAHVASAVADLVYVEGYARGALFTVHHAWVTDDGASAFDVTWPADDRHAGAYFGIAWDPDFLADLCDDTGIAGVLAFDIPHDRHLELFTDGPPDDALWYPVAPTTYTL